MHKHISFVITAAILITAIATVALYTVNAAHAQEQQQVGQTQVNKLWETPANLKNPESVDLCIQAKYLVCFKYEWRPR